MRLKVLDGHCVVLPNKTVLPGGGLELPAAEGKRLIAKGVARAVEKAKPAPEKDA